MNSNLPLHCLAPWFANFVCELSNCTQIPEEVIALYVLAIFAAILQGRFSLQVKSGCDEPICLYILSILPFRSKKHEMLKYLIQPVQHAQTVINEKIAQERNQLKAQIAILKKQIAQQTSLAAQVGVDQKQETDKLAKLNSELESIDIPNDYRLIIFNASRNELEALMHMQEGNAAAICIENSTPSYKQLQQSSSFYKNSYHGNPITSLRKGLKDFDIEHPRLSLLLNASLDCLPYFIDKYPNENDLGPLFQYAICRPQNDHKGTNAGVSAQSLYEYQQAIEAALYSNDTGTITLSDDAMQMFVELELELKNQPKPPSEQEKFGEWQALYPKHILRIAGILHCVQHAGAQPHTHKLSSDTLSKAIQLVEYYKQHAMYAYGIRNKAQVFENVSYLVKKFIELKCTTITLRNLFQKTKGYFRDTEHLAATLDSLVTSKAVKIEYIATRGRPSTLITVNQDSLEHIIDDDE